MKTKLKELMSRLFTVPAAPSLRGAGKRGRGLTHATTRGRVGYGALLAVALCGVVQAATLQELIDATPAGGTCIVPPGEYLPATVSNEKTGVTLVGAGADETIIVGGGTNRCLLVEARDVVLKGFTFRDGYAASNDKSGNGGGVLERGTTNTLEVCDCVFEGCTAAESGGGLYQAKSVADCRFVTCESKSTDGGGGGGEYSVLTTERCNFISCRTSNSGGAICTPRRITSVISDCTFVDCVATAGGAVRCAGYKTTPGHSRVERCAFTNCQVTGSNSGGAVYDVEYVADSTFSNCTSGWNGGGAFGVFSLTGCTFTDCSAKSCGGGAGDVQTVEDCAFTGCRAVNSDGGGFDIGTFDSVVSNCTFTECSATGSGGGVHGIVIKRIDTTNYYGRVENCTFVRCVAEKNGGGCSDFEGVRKCVFSQCTAAELGGGACDVFELHTSLLVGNTAGTSGGGSYNTGSYSCTYATNSVAGETGAEGSGVSGDGAAAYDCLFYDCRCAAAMDSSYEVGDDPFIDRANGDYHLRADRVPYLPGDAERAKNYVKAAMTDLEGRPLIREALFVAGCYVAPYYYKVSYDGNGAAGTMATDEFFMAVTTNLTANAYTAVGYAFAGWTTNGCDEVAYADGAAGVDFAEPGETLELKAKWTDTGVEVATFDALTNALVTATNQAASLPVTVKLTGDVVVPQGGIVKVYASPAVTFTGTGTFDVTAERPALFNGYPVGTGLKPEDLDRFVTDKDVKAYYEDGKVVVRGRGETEEFPWLLGTAGHEDEVTAWAGDEMILTKPARGTASVAAFQSVTNALSGYVPGSGELKVISADGTATNDVVMLLGSDGVVYDTLAEVLAADPMPETVRLFEVKGYFVSYDGKRNGIREHDRA